MNLKKLILICIALNIEAATVTRRFTNGGAITFTSGLANEATPFPSTIVADIPSNATITRVSVELRSFSATQPNQVTVLLRAPDPAPTPSVLPNANLILMNNTSNGAAIPVNNPITLILNDEAPALLPNTFSEYPATDTTRRPASYSAILPAPFLGANQPEEAGTSTFASSFNGINGNGTWELFVYNNFPDNNQGMFADGWVLELTYEIPDIIPGCSISGRRSALFDAIRNKFGL